ncbi:hypothetical protein [Micromonospora rubida]|uniref:hypothetical protein n=1 Tax=Micromonospora rubida TaxID=2697657 RepID=UPI0013771140|nr:hypothetical protein [Micromonospora rubida]NBE82803.1 hypothetical protein [Micromonospora rubida]
MPAIHRRLSMLAAALVLVVAGSQIALPGRSTGHATAESGFAKYCMVGESRVDETLATVAGRILGDESRAGELYRLNVNRVQPDGGVLTDPNRLQVGWYLVLPWDAVGDEVRYGRLPDREGALPSPVALPSVDPAAAAPPEVASGSGTASRGSDVARWLSILLAAVLLSLVAVTALWWWRTSLKDWLLRDRRAVAGAPRHLGTSSDATSDQA